MKHCAANRTRLPFPRVSGGRCRAAPAARRMGALPPILSPGKSGRGRPRSRHEFHHPHFHCHPGRGQRPSAGTPLPFSARGEAGSRIASDANGRKRPGFASVRDDRTKKGGQDWRRVLVVLPVQSPSPPCPQERAGETPALPGPRASRPLFFPVVAARHPSGVPIKSRDWTIDDLPDVLVLFQCIIHPPAKPRTPAPPQAPPRKKDPDEHPEARYRAARPKALHKHCARH